MCRRALQLSHMFFADDSITFYRVKMEECSKIWEVLHDYEIALGQKINKEKTSIFFNKNTNDAIQGEIKDLFGA